MLPATEQIRYVQPVNSRDEATVPAIVGLRAIAVLWMIGFHVIFCFGYHASAAQYTKIIKHPFLAILAQGHLAVDLFFVISGYLIAHLLYREFRIHGRIHVGQFYYRRWMRIMPAYIVVVLISHPILTGESNIENAWANILLINNFLPLQQQAIPWSWSIAIECQFYALAPGLVMGWQAWWRRGTQRPQQATGPRPTWLIPLLILAAACAIRAGLGLAHPGLGHGGDGSPRIGWLHIPYLFHSEYDWDCFHDYFNLIYDKLYGRFAPLLFGAYVVHLEHRPAVMRWVASQSSWPRLLHIASLLAIPSCVWFSFHLTHRLNGNGLSALLGMACYRVLFGASFAYFFLHIIASRACGRYSVISRFLSWHSWRPVATLSYSAYLVHPLIILALWSALAARSAQHSVTVWVWFLPLAYVLTFAAAALLHGLVEAPLRDFSRRQSPTRTSRPE